MTWIVLRYLALSFWTCVIRWFLTDVYRWPYGRPRIIFLRKQETVLFIYIRKTLKRSICGRSENILVTFWNKRLPLQYFPRKKPKLLVSLCAVMSVVVKRPSLKESRFWLRQLQTISGHGQRCTRSREGQPLKTSLTRWWYLLHFSDVEGSHACFRM